LLEHSLGRSAVHSLALAAIAGAAWIGIPLEAIMLKISDGVSKVAMLTIPFFVLAGAIMAEGGMAKRGSNVLMGVMQPNRVSCTRSVRAAQSH
jgi:TRAP-type mannitol/chloroaromatic compound transport system permease large subunit